MTATITATINQAKAMLSKIPRRELGFFPTPLYRLDNLSEELGVNLWIKRDDFTGSNLFGGNKTRKLEFLMGKALEDGAEYAFTYGATQSNHAMQTIWAATKNGIKPVVYLAAVVPPDKDDYKANLLLDSVFGAEIHIVDLEEGESFEDAEYRSFELGKSHIARLEAEGKKCMDIPMGGANEYGTLGYLNAMIELAEQMRELCMTSATNKSPDTNSYFDHMYHATGSGGTMAGIAAGKKLLGLDMRVHSITAMGVGDGFGYAENAAKLANGALELIGVNSLTSSDLEARSNIVHSTNVSAFTDVANVHVTPDDFIIDQNHYAPGYECPSEEATEAIKLLTKREGILVDPVYSGKAFAGMLSDIRNGKIEKGSNVLFLHTGGATVFFAEKEILGALVD